MSRPAPKASSAPKLRALQRAFAAGIMHPLTPGQRMQPKGSNGKSARKAAARGKVRPFVVEPEVIINNQWSDRYTVIEVSGLDRPGLLYQLTTAISKLNLNIASAHVATFGERARDVFYVTDLLGAQINAPTRQAAIKSALLHLLSQEEKATKPAV